LSQGVLLVHRETEEVREDLVECLGILPEHHVPAEDFDSRLGRILFEPRLAPGHVLFTEDVQARYFLAELLELRTVVGEERSGSKVGPGLILISKLSINQRAPANGSTVTVRRFGVFPQRPLADLVGQAEVGL
jgi:hypothetical protein